MKSGWAIKKLGEVCELIADGDWIESKDQSTSGIRLVQTGNVGVGVFRNKEGSEHFISSEAFRSLNCTEIFGGDILISRLPDPVGRACVVPDLGQKMVTAVDCSIVRLRRSVCLSQFLVYYASSVEWFNAIEAKCTGSTRKRISRKNLTDVLVPVPPISEQKRIVAKIDAAFEKIDKLKANAERNLKNAKELFQSALDEAMRPKKGWVEKRLGEVADFYAGHTPKPIDLNGVDGIPYFKVSDMNRKGNEHGMSITELFVKRPKKVYPKGGIAFPKNGGAALTNKKRILQQDSVVDLNTEVICAKEMMGSEFLFYLFSSFDVCEYIRGAALPTVDMAGLRNRIVFIPSLNEQRQIVKRLDILAEKTELLEQHYRRQIADCAEMRQSVLRAAFEGRL